MHNFSGPRVGNHAKLRSSGDFVQERWAGNQNNDISKTEEQAMKIKDAVVVITGAAGGIGRAVALEFARRGAAGLALVDHNEAIHDVGREVTPWPTNRSPSVTPGM